MREESVITPSALMVQLRHTLNSLPPGWVEGEVVRCGEGVRGEMLLSVADALATVSCVMRRQACRLRLGELVRAHYRSVTSTSHGRALVEVDKVEPVTPGALACRAHETLQRLRAEGLCDASHKRPLPPYPKQVAVIAPAGTSLVDAAVNAIRARWPAQDIVAVPTAMRGLDAAGRMIDAIAQAQAVCDAALLVIPPGTSAQLRHFDDEGLCRAVFASAMPTVCAVTARARTPNCVHVAAAAAGSLNEAVALLVPSRDQVQEELDHARSVLSSARVRINQARSELAAVCAGKLSRSPLMRLQSGVALADVQLAAAARVFFTDRRSELDVITHLARAAAHRRIPPSATLDAHARQLATAAHRQHTRFRTLTADTLLLAGGVAAAARRRITASREGAQALANQVRARDPRRRGFALVRAEGGEPLVSAVEASARRRVRLEFADGEVEATITTDKEQR